MGLGRPGHRIARQGDREAAQGVTILSGAGCNPVAGKMVGPLPSLMRTVQDHHAGSAVKPDQSSPPQTTASNERCHNESGPPGSAWLFPGEKTERKNV